MLLLNTTLSFFVLQKYQRVKVPYCLAEANENMYLIDKLLNCSTGSTEYLSKTN
jgi:hypothetical protein